MKNHKVYEADDKMISLIRDNYNVLQSLGCFGINLGFGDKTVNETCCDNGVDTYTFLAVVNYTINAITTPMMPTACPSPRFCIIFRHAMSITSTTSCRRYVANCRSRSTRKTGWGS